MAMSNEGESRAGASNPAVYQLRIEGRLDPQWEEWFDGMAITPRDDGTTLLTSPMVDQAALYGVLKKVRDLGLPLLSVIRVELGQAGEPDSETQGNAHLGKETRHRHDFPHCHG
jgi:hypothetical protein